MDLPSLYRVCVHLATNLSDVQIDNTSWNELSRRQVCKDLIREEVIVNGAIFHHGDDSYALKHFLLNQVLPLSLYNQD